jgi:predicted helicase
MPPKDQQPNIVGFEQAVARFKEDTPRIAEGLVTLIHDAHTSSKAFQAVFADFMALCKNALNPNISAAAVDEMLIQHLLTERLMRTVFDSPDFARRNIIANEIEKVIAALRLNRKGLLGQLDYFYEAIEAAAQDLNGFSAKQHFINTVFEKFFQGYAVKVADTHGIVYTPQPIVDFMCAAVEEVLEDAFGCGLEHPDVCIIDPATGTGNFIIHLLHRIQQCAPQSLPNVYAHRLFANEVMMLPYYVASLNIEHAYYELTGEYAPFEGLCFVDTLDLAEGAQMKFAFMSEENSARVERQKAAKITVIIGNPPYNAGQVNENDNNKNRKYPVLDQRVYETYSRDSAAKLNTKLYDPYVKFFRWATDRLQGREGVVCFVSNNSFIDQKSFDGMRKHLLQDFTRVYHLDLGGNVRQNSKLQGLVHNVFEIQVGVGITVAVRSSSHSESKLFYHRVPEYWRKEEKLAFLAQNTLNSIEWAELVPDKQHTWLVGEHADEFASFMPMGSKEAKAAKGLNAEAIFKTYSLGASSNRDDVVYDFDRAQLLRRIEQFSAHYNAEVERFKRRGNHAQSVDEFVDYTNVKWSSDLKRRLRYGDTLNFSPDSVRRAIYRPFSKRYGYLADIAVDELSQMLRIFPHDGAENVLIGVVNEAQIPFSAQVANCIPAMHYGGRQTQCFPFYLYDEDGNRRENITDWALGQFQAHYGDEGITKWDIFYYVYAVLHHPTYRSKYADHLKREFPRIPFVVEFRAFAGAGRRLVELHLNYETVEPYPLVYRWREGKAMSYQVEKMRLTPLPNPLPASGEREQIRALVVNEALTLRGIPAETLAYQIGNRSALEWVIQQYQVREDKRTGIRSDPNAYEDEHYIVNLIGRVIQVSVETVAIVKGLPPLE